MEMRSESIGELAKALAAAQGEIKGAPKDSTNPFFNSRYADLASVWDACRGPLSKNGLAVIQLTHEPERVDAIFAERAIVETVLTHSSGEWISSRLSMPVHGPALKGGGHGPIDAQSYGKAISYARRYALASTVGIYQEDDDGNSASGKDAPMFVMDESKLADHLAAIEATADVDQLKAVFAKAIKDSGGDQGAQRQMIAAKDARKAALA